ncbi:hypothetical protein ES703_02115 [subsurface metagenome]
MVREAHRRIRKYEKNIDPEQTKRKLQRVRGVMIDLETPYLAQIAEIERKVKRICEALGVQTFEIAQYINYARQLYSKCKKFEGATLTNEAQYLTTHWISRGLLCSILILIAKLFGITVTCVVAPTCSPYICEAKVGHRILSFYIVQSDGMKSTGLWEDSVVAQFFPVFRPMTFSHFTVYTIAGAPPNDLMRLALYDSDGNLVPNNLLLETAPFAPIAWAWHDVAIPPITLQAGMYFLAWQAINDQITIVYTPHFVSPLQNDPPLGLARSLITAWAVDQAWGAFPDPFPAPTWVDNYYYWMGLLLSALP